MCFDFVCIYVIVMAKRIEISESQLLLLKKSILHEDVFASGINDRNKTVELSYVNGGSAIRRNKFKGESLKTDKMESLGADTYEIPLKGGMMSYNITSINGTAVMHYFKNYFNSKKSTVDINGDKYTMIMDDTQFSHFMRVFLRKVNNVISYHTNEFGTTDAEYVAIYPVPSSSNFNTTIADIILKNSIGVYGLKTIVIDDALLKKDVSKITKDEDFVNKNLDYYNSMESSLDKFSTKGSVSYRGTQMNQLDNEIGRFANFDEVNKQIEYLNTFTENRRGHSKGELVRLWHQMCVAFRDGRTIRRSTIIKLDNVFRQYQEEVAKLIDIASYWDFAREKMNRPHLSKVAEAIKYAKGPSIEKRKNGIYDYLRSQGLARGLSRHLLYDVCMWQPINFQIKSLMNGIRLGMKDIFSFDDKKLQEEYERLKKSIIVVFDDNISGGATLSDVCYQFKKLGLTKIIPITFGKMREYNQMGAKYDYKFDMS